MIHSRKKWIAELPQHWLTVVIGQFRIILQITICSFCGTMEPALSIWEDQNELIHCHSFATILRPILLNWIERLRFSILSNLRSMKNSAVFASTIQPAIIFQIKILIGHWEKFAQSIFTEKNLALSHLMHA